MQRRFTPAVAGLAVASMLLVGAAGCCPPRPQTQSARQDLRQDVQDVVQRVQTQDPSLKNLMDRSSGYAVFPNVGKGGLVVGGAYGRGIVYQNGQMIGYADLTQGTVGAQIGGQAYHEVLVFQDAAALDRFKQGKFALAANVSAVILKAGAADAARFSDGIAVFVDPIAGAMAEASIGGQTFTFQPAEQGQ